MSAVENGVILQSSVSQIEHYDPNQTGGCPRAWWFERVHFLRPEQHDAQSEGEKGHALFADFFMLKGPPKGRVKMGKHVTAAILKGDLPKPGPDMIVEERFDGQPKFDAAGNWIPLDTTNTLWLGGVPLDGFIDLAYRRDDIPVILDHKFMSDPDTYAKPNEGLIKTAQMPTYVLSQRPYWPDAKHWRLVHHYLSRAKAGHSFMRSAVVHIDQVLEREADIVRVIGEMKDVAKLTNQDEVPFSRKACHTWLGCAHQSICNAYRRNQLELNPDELAMFEKDFAETPTPSVDVEPDPFAEPADFTKPAEVDEEALLAQQLEKLRAAKAAKAAKAQADAAAAKAKAEEAAKAEKARKIKITDVSTPVASNPTPPAPACGPCGEQLTPQNGSKLQDGTWKHIGCPAVLPPDAPASKPELASEQPAPAAKQRKPKADPVPPPVSPPPAGSGTLPRPASAPGEITLSLKIDPDTLALLRQLLNK